MHGAPKKVCNYHAIIYDAAQGEVKKLQGEYFLKTHIIGESNKRRSFCE
tara:strand:+ start:7960 stop:8106 length:147 start_codon:yes stop_codon:yes gene_type:complete